LSCFQRSTSHAPENLDNSNEVKALEHLSYINACARMEFLNANSKLINYHVGKKKSTSKKKINDLSNKSMDLTLTLRSDIQFEKAQKK
jgi:hypothetical protein